MAVVAKIYEKKRGKPAKRASTAITPPRRISAINIDGLPNRPSLKAHQMPTIRFLDEIDNVSVSSQLSDVEMEQVQKEIKMISAIQKTDMIALEDKLIAIMAKLEERDEEQKTEEFTG
jgi:hypothetical protein